MECRCEDTGIGKFRKPCGKHFHVSIHCNGNGACFNFDLDDVMCPSYKLTRDRQALPERPGRDDARVAAAIVAHPAMIYRPEDDLARAPGHP